MTQNQEKGFFFALTPERVLEAVEASGLRCTGRCLALNSFENRVYDVEFETDEAELQETTSAVTRNRKVVKFYRPGRWTKDQILEEHQFLSDLQAAEIPAIAPEKFPDGSTVQQTVGSSIFYAIFPKIGGRAPDELSADQLIRIGRLLGRIHNVGAQREAHFRIQLTPQTYGIENLQFLMAGSWIPKEFETRYQKVVEEICRISEPHFAKMKVQRLHGDCHLGNLLWNQNGPFFLDFDDMVLGPEVQDLWLLLPGRDQETRQQREILLEGYQEFRSFDRKSLKWIEALRALRFVHYTTWVAKRWDDPAFPRAFPEFGTHRYWTDEVEDLEKQLAYIREDFDQGVVQKW